MNAGFVDHDNQVPRLQDPTSPGSHYLCAVWLLKADELGILGRNRANADAQRRMLDTACGEHQHQTEHHQQTKTA